MLHDDLFIRTPDGMQPTPRAEQMAEPVRDALRVLRITLEPEAFEPASRRAASSGGEQLCRACHRAGPWRARWAIVAPHVSLDIKPIGMRDVLDQLDAGGMDVALSTLVDGGERFKCVRVMDDDFVVLLAGRMHPAAKEAVLSGRAVGGNSAYCDHVEPDDDTSFIDERSGATRPGAQDRHARAIPLGRADAGRFRPAGGGAAPRRQ